MYNVQVSTRSTEDLFTIQMPENQLLVQAERLGSSTSSSIQVGVQVPAVVPGRCSSTSSSIQVGDQVPAVVSR